MVKSNLVFSKKFSWIWNGSLLVYSILIFIFSLVNIPFLPISLRFPFPLFVPGYSFITVTFSETNVPEKILGSVGFSITFYVGLKALTEVLLETSYFSELTILSFTSIILLTRKLYASIQG